MPQLAVAAAGAWAGSAIGGTFLGVTAASWGWMAGSLLGSLLFAPDGPKAQMGDTRVPKIDFGSRMTRVYGTVRVPLNPRWIDDFTATEQSAGGKGGGGGSSYYTYTTNALYWVADGINVQGVRKIWKNGELVYNNDAGADAATIEASQNSEHWSDMQFFDGNASQMPWSVYEAAVGSVNADAHRRIACIAMQNIACGNSPQVPFFEAEVYTNGTTANVCVVLDRNDAFGWTPGADQPTGTDWNPFVPQVERNWEVSGAEAELSGLVNSWQPGGIAEPIYTQTFTISTPPVSGGCRYAEILFVVEDSSSANDTGILGVKTGGGDWWGMNYPGVAVSSAGGDSNISGSWSSDGTVIMLAYKDGNLWIGRNGSWLEAGATPADPATGTVPTHTGIEDAISIFVDYFAGIPSVQIVLRTKLADFDYSPPAGFDEWSATFQSATVVTPLPEDLADVVSAECLRCEGVTSDDFDVTDLVGIEVDGFKCEGSARSAIEQLMAAYYFTAVPGRKVVFKRLDQSAVVSIPAADTGVGVDQAGEVFAGLMRANDLELPAQVSITGPNPSADHDPATATSDRLITVGNRIEQATWNVVFTPAQMKGRANANALDARVATHTATIAVSDKYAAYEIGDVVTHADEEGNSYTTRWLRESYAQGAKSVDVRLFDRSVLTLTGTMSDTYTPAVTVRGSASIETALILDTPIFSDADDSYGLYVTATGTGRWQGATVYKSTDGASYTQVAQLATRGVIGDASVLPDFVGWTWDDASTLTVTLDEGAGATLTSSTKTAIEADQSINAAVVGVHGRWEAINFVTATLVSGTTYTLTGFLRGQKGTEWANGTHASGDKFVLLRTVGIARIAGEAGDVGAVRYYKVVPAGATLADATAISITTAEQGLKPYAPVDIRATADSRIVWSRRSRLDYPPPYTQQPPLGEASESYELDIMSGSTVLRTIATSAPTCDYLPTMQVEDFGAVQSSVSVRVYQLGAIGRGHHGIATVPLPTGIAQQATITFGGVFTVGERVFVTVNGAPLTDYTVVSGDTDLDGVAASVAAAIDATPTFAATAAGTVVTVTGPAGVSYVLGVTLQPADVISIGMGQSAAPAGPGLSYISSPMRIHNFLTGQVYPVPPGQTFWLRVQDFQTLVSESSFTSNANTTDHFSVLGSLQAVFNGTNLGGTPSAAYNAGYRFQISSDSFGYYGYLIGPLGFQGAVAVEKRTSAFYLSAGGAVQNGAPAVPADRPQTARVIVGPTTTIGSLAVDGLTYRVTLDGVDFDYTATTGDTHDDVAAALAALIDGDADYSATSTGWFADIAGQPNVPYTMSASIVGTSITAAIGP